MTLNSRFIILCVYFGLLLKCSLHNETDPQPLPTDLRDLLLTYSRPNSKSVLSVCRPPTAPINYLYLTFEPSRTEHNSKREPTLTNMLLKFLSYVYYVFLCIFTISLK